MPIENRYIKINNKKINSLQRYDTAQANRIQLTVFSICLNIPSTFRTTIFQFFFFIKSDLGIRDTNKVAEKYSRLHINVFIFRFGNMG
jgi:hypothetical protein